MRFTSSIVSAHWCSGFYKLFFASSIVILMMPTATAFGADSFFALCSNNNVFDNPTYLPKLVQTGAPLCRIDGGFNVIRKNPGNDPSKWDWSSMEKVHSAAKRYPQMRWLPIIGFGTKWAADSKFSGADIALPQRNINVMPAESPENLYGNFVYELVSRYKDVVHDWECWNEPDLPGHPFFSGNGRDFLPYQRACYLAAKKADPHCNVVFAGLCYASMEGYMYSHHLKPPTYAPMKSSFLEEYLQAVAKDPEAKAHNYYFDVMNQHSYSRATDLSDYTQILNKLMHDYLGQEKPIWFTETGFVDQGGPFGGNADDYCDYLLQSFCWAKQMGVQKQFHFQLDNSNGHGLYAAMLGAPKPALATYKFLTSELSNARFVAQIHGRMGVGFLSGNSPYQPNWQTGYNLFEFRTPDGKRVLIGFSDTNKPMDIDIVAKEKSAVLVNRSGQRTVINSVNGQYKIHLPGATNLAGFPISDDPKAKALGSPEHLVGGSTQIVIEQ